ncbi:MAG: hypothetical protein GXP31_17690 [Kiritimatiellaeota bacterium]|nr:hypothetical protein [Kiritimatiellota bacterium]
MPRAKVREVTENLGPALRAMRLLWGAVAAGKLVYLAVGQALEGKTGLPALDPGLLRLLITAVSGLGALAAVSSILVHVGLRRTAVRRSRDVNEYIRRMTQAQLVGLAMCDGWALGALVLRLLGAGAVVQTMLTVAAVFADFFHYPQTSDLVQDAVSISERRRDDGDTGDAAAVGGARARF